MDARWAPSGATVATVMIVSLLVTSGATISCVHALPGQLSDALAFRPMRSEVVIA